MTSWLWMKGVDVAVADPIDPVCPEDDRPSVKELVEQHSGKIQKLRDAVFDHPLFDEAKHDDLFLLRFWLSHKKSKPAIDAIKHTLKFRKEHKLDETDIRNTPPTLIKEGKVRAFLDCWGDDAIVFTHPDPKRGVIVFLNLASMDQHEVVNKLTEDYWLLPFLMCSEWSFQWLDYVTRTTGRLTKSVRIIDGSGIQMSGFNRECSKRDGKVMGLMEDCYPQLLETLFMCSPPVIIQALWKLIKVILPKRVLEKFDIMDPAVNENDRKRFYRHISDENLPAMFGGKNPQTPTDMVKSEFGDSNGTAKVEEEIWT